MPNWVMSSIIVNNEKDFEKLKELLVNENGQIDFEKLIPTPQDLNITAGCYEWETDVYNLGFKNDIIAKQNEILKPLLDKIYDVYNNNNTTKDTLTQERFVNTAINFSDVVNAIQKVHNRDDIQNEDLKNVLKGYYNFRKYGFVNWYDFHNVKWGTKWNVDDTACIGNLSMCFQTAWDTPLGIFKELSKHIDFTVGYADEDIGSNFGVIEVKNGEAYIDNFEDLSKEEKYYVSSILNGQDDYDYEELCEMCDIPMISKEERKRLNTELNIDRFY